MPPAAGAIAPISANGRTIAAAKIIIWCSEQSSWHGDLLEDLLDDFGDRQALDFNSGRNMMRCSRTGWAINLTSSGVTKSRPEIAAWARAAMMSDCVARGPAPT